MKTPEKKLQELREVTWSELDKDPALEQALRSAFFFFYDIMMKDVNDEYCVTGCSFSQRGLNTLLVLKAVVDGVPQVAFVTDKFPIDCVSSLGRQVRDGTLKWHLDRFAQT